MAWRRKTLEDAFLELVAKDRIDRVMAVRGGVSV